MRKSAFEAASLARIAGFGLNRIVSMFTYSILLQMLGVTTDQLPYLLAACASVFVAICFLWLISFAVKRFQSLVASRFFIPAIALCTLLGLAIILSLRGEGQLAIGSLGLFILGAIPLSIGSAGLFLCWGVAFSKFEGRKILAEMGAGFVLALVILAPFNLLPLEAQAVLLMLACGADASVQWYLRKLSRILPQENLEGEKTVWVRKKMYAGMACYGAAMGLSTSLLSHSGLAVYLPDSLARMFFGLVIFGTAAFVVRFFKRDPLLASYRFAYLIIALNTTALLLFPEKDPVFLALLFVGHLLVIVTCMSLLFGVAHKIPDDHIRIIASGVAAFLFGDLITRGGHDLLALSNILPADALNLVFTLALMSTVILAYALVFSERDISKIEAIINDIAAKKEAPQENSQLAQNAFIEAIVAQYKLTPRETDVVTLMLIGRSSPRIQSELFISESTVHTHTRHIYNKMTIRSRQELIDLYTDWIEKTSPVRNKFE